jgi:ubiquinone/menaquinone biosynthesis C-methylase UbiE
MNVEEAYYRGAKSFDFWVRLMESHTRRMQVEDSSHRGSRALIISAPTDCGIPLVASANRNTETNLLCFSDRTGRIATEYCARRGCQTVKVTVAPFFRIPFDNSYFSTVYANCFFDFCLEDDLDPILDEIWRVLKVGGSLLTVNMVGASTARARMWLWILRRLSVACEGLHPIAPAPRIGRRGFRILKDRSVSKLGFPMNYTHAEKLTAVV